MIVIIDLLDNFATKRARARTYGAKNRNLRKVYDGLSSVHKQLLIVSSRVSMRSNFWRGGRAAEGARLESVYISDYIGGSNPPLSATLRSPNFGRQARSELELGVSNEAFLSNEALA